MKVLFELAIITLTLNIFVSCNSYDDVCEKMDEIKAIGDTNQNLAFAMLDSIKPDVTKADEHTRMKYDLLTILIYDKANIKPTSDFLSKHTTSYFEHHGSNLEKQTRSYYLSIIFIVLSILVVVTIIAIHIYLKNKNFRKTLALTNELNIINKELIDLKKKLKESEDALSEKRDQYEKIIGLLHKTEFEINSEEVINAVRQSAYGSKKMSTSEWRQLYQAVDELYPDFKKLIAQKLSCLTEQQIQLCYLMRIGLTKPQIQNITSIPHVTVWRWTKKFSWASCANGSL